VVRIDGPTTVTEGETNSWTSTAVQLAEPQYLWLFNGETISTDRTLSASFTNVGENELEVQVTAAGFRTTTRAEIDLTVEEAVPPEEQGDAQVVAQPSEESQFRLPFGALNAFPGVTGVEDLVLTVPQLADIEDALDRRVPSLDEVAAQARQGVLERTLPESLRTVEGVLDDLAQLDLPEVDDIPTVEEIVEEIEIPTAADLADEVPGTQDIAETVVQAIEFPEIPQPPSVQEIADEAEEEIVSPLEGFLSAQTQALRTEIDDVVGDIGDDLADDFDSLGQAVQGAVDDIAGVQEDVETVLDDLGTALDRLPEDFQQAVQNGLEAGEPTVDDVGLFSDPVGFFGAALSQGFEAQADDGRLEEIEDRLQEIEELAEDD